MTVVLGTNNHLSVDVPRELLTDETADTYDASLETRLSTVIHGAVSTLLNESILSNIVFEIDNLLGKPIGHVIDADSYIDGVFAPMHANTFLNMFIARVWNALTNGNVTPIKIMVMGMVESDTTIIIETDGRHPVTYRYPTFADSKFLPIIMNNDRLDLLSEDYGTLIDAALHTTRDVIKDSIDNSQTQVSENSGIVNQYGAPVGARRAVGVQY